MKYVLIIMALSVAGCSANKYFVVRHAEKAAAEPGVTAMMVTDPPLSPAGELRAVELSEQLKDANIQYIFSTNFKRTISTARPLNEARATTHIDIYNSSRDSLDLFIEKLKMIKKGNVLIVGHSNTIDDIANRLCGKTVIPGDLKETQYDNLFVIKRKGHHFTFVGKKYGVLTSLKNPGPH